MMLKVRGVRLAGLRYCFLASPNTLPKVALRVSGIKHLCDCKASWSHTGMLGKAWQHETNETHETHETTYFLSSWLHETHETSLFPVLIGTHWNTRFTPLCELHRYKHSSKDGIFQGSITLFFLKKIRSPFELSRPSPALTSSQQWLGAQVEWMLIWNSEILDFAMPCHQWLGPTPRCVQSVWSERSWWICGPPSLDDAGGGCRGQVGWQPQVVWDAQGLQWASPYLVGSSWFLVWQKWSETDSLATNSPNSMICWWQWHSKIDYVDLRRPNLSSHASYPRVLAGCES